MQYLCVLVIVALFACTQSEYSTDQIILSAYNRSVYIANETYKFVLVPQYLVPLQLFRHTIYTASSATVAASMKRALWQSRKRSIELSPEDHDLLSSYIKESLPSYVKVNTKKRSVENQFGLRTIDLGNRAVVLVRGSFGTQKRQLDGVALGTSLCLSIPFFTTCDNQGDVDQLKSTLQFQATEFQTELDAYTATNNARANEMATVLNKQRSLIQSIAAETGDTATFINSVASAAAANAAQQSHGDFIAHAQINYLQRVTNSLLRFANAMTSSDQRTVVAQPSLSQLFQGYLDLLAYLQNTSNSVVYQPIIDSRIFNWTESTLPVDSVSNIVAVDGPYVTMQTLISQSVGLLAVTTVSCQQCSSAGQTGCEPIAAPWTYSCSTSNYFVGTPAMRSQTSQNGDQWFFGPFHQAHMGVYPIASGNPQASTTTVAYYNVSSITSPPYNIFKPTIQYGVTVNSEPIAVTTLYCVDFLGFKSLATFNVTPSMLNGIPSVMVSNWSDCDDYFFRTPTEPSGTWFLFGVTEGIAVPFYSNCEPAQLISETNSTTPIGYLGNYPSFVHTRPSLAASYLYSTYTMNAKHMVSPNCYINLEPEWIAMDYYFPTTPVVIPNIPRGYSLNQFTINPAGELSSSLTFMYTQNWAWVYQIQRVSNNTVVVDEAEALDGSQVLFNIAGTNVTDESDSFFGAGNNGRDCIINASTYDYDLTSCFFQNNELSYGIDEYLAGNIVTTGIARYTNEFEFSLNTWATTYDGAPFTSYSFSLVPLDTADFSYVLDLEGEICPQTFPPSSSSSLSGCTFTFYYTGTLPISIGQTPTTATLMSFDVNNMTSYSFNYGSNSPLSAYLYAGGTQCSYLTCSRTDPSYTLVANPQTHTIFATDVQLNDSISYANSQTASSVAALASIQQSTQESQKNLSAISAYLGTLDFNVTQVVPYTDFSALRASVDNFINSLSPAGSRDCASGMFGSVGCWFQDAASTLIVIAIIAAVAVGLYCLCIKFNLFGKIFNKSSEF